MNIILGASGQVGSAIINFLTEKNVPVRAVVRDAKKAEAFIRKGAEIAIADYLDLKALKNSVKGGKLIFLITPEHSQTDDILGDTKLILENYRKAIADSEIKSVIGLSSGGAHYEKYEKDTGNLLMSNMLEHEFVSLPIHQLFVRPSYYYSNWLMSVDMVKEQGILPSFYPVNLKMDMNSPIDVAKYVANKIIEGVEKSDMKELIGPEKYSANDVADEMSKVLGRELKAQEIPKEKWAETMKAIGFSEDATSNFIKMTALVAGGTAELQGERSSHIRLKTTLGNYLEENL